MLSDNFGRRHTSLLVSPRVGQPYLENTELCKSVVCSRVLGIYITLVEGIWAFAKCAFRNVERNFRRFEYQFVVCRRCRALSSPGAPSLAAPPAS
jgi:hypothetical protein